MELSVLATIIVALIGIFGNWFLSNQNKKEEIILGNLKKYWENQDNLFQEVLKTASDLTFIEEIESDEFQNAYKRLWRLIYGELPMYDVQKVEIALEKFANLAYVKKRINPKDVDEIKKVKKEMKPYLTNISKALRESSSLLSYSKRIPVLNKGLQG